MANSGQGLPLAGRTTPEAFGFRYMLQPNLIRGIDACVCATVHTSRFAIDYSRFLLRLYETAFRKWESSFSVARERDEQTLLPA